MHPEEQYALRAYKSGASGYVTKGPVSELLITLNETLAGQKIYQRRPGRIHDLRVFGADTDRGSSTRSQS